MFITFININDEQL